MAFESGRPTKIQKTRRLEPGHLPPVIYPKSSNKTISLPSVLFKFLKQDHKDWVTAYNIATKYNDELPSPPDGVTIGECKEHGNCQPPSDPTSRTVRRITNNDTKDDTKDDTKYDAKDDAKDEAKDDTKDDEKEDSESKQDEEEKPEPKYEPDSDLGTLDEANKKDNSTKSIRFNQGLGRTRRLANLVDYGLDDISSTTTISTDYDIYS